MRVNPDEKYRRNLEVACSKEFISEIHATAIFLLCEVQPMITIYGITSPYASRVRAALLQKGLPFQHVNVNMTIKSAEFKGLTPTETIPVVEDNGVVMCDSLHALMYLDEKYPHTYPMLGPDLPTKIKILSVIAAVDKIASFFGPLYVEKGNREETLRKNHASHKAFRYDEQQKQDLRKDIAYRMGKIEKILGEKQFFSGQFSAADAAMLALLRQLDFFGETIPQFWQKWRKPLLEDQKIAAMFAPQDEKGVREI